MPARAPDGASLSKAARIRRRTLVGGGLTLALAALLGVSAALESAAFVLAAGWLVALGAALETARMGTLAARGLRPALVAALLLALALEARWLARGEGPLDGLAWHALAVAGAAALLHAPRAARGSAPGRAVVAAAGLAAWVLLPLPWLARVWAGWGTGGLVALLVLAKLGDVAGYYVGSAIGRTHPFPRTSPGKTTAGCVASLVAGTAAGAGCVAAGLLPAGTLGLLGGALAGALVNVAAQAGDLAESRLKRLAAVKDSGTWFGPSGGVLDLVDSLLLAVPVALAAWSVLFPAAPAPG